MGTDTKIAWATHTFNPWWGCEKVSEACKHCYAESMARRWGHQIWGRAAARRPLGDANWKQPLAWDRHARENGVRARVFCASMADVMEDRRDLDPLRERLWKLIDRTPSLDWMLLTKRPENFLRLTSWRTRWPDNVWAGTTAETQAWAARRWAHLREVPAVVRFLSVEPMLEPMDLLGLTRSDADRPLHWVIVGGESGPGARRTDPSWFMELQRQSAIADIAYFLKQSGLMLAKELGFADRAGADPDEWPAAWRIQEFPR